MPVCRVCRSESNEKICPQCGASFQMVEWFLDRKRIIYLIVIYVFLVLQIFVLRKVVPTFADVFNSFGAALPAPTALLIDLSRWVAPVGGLLFLALTALFVLLMVMPDIRRKLSTVFLLVLAILLGLSLFPFIGALFMPMFELGNQVK